MLIQNDFFKHSKNRKTYFEDLFRQCTADWQKEILYFIENFYDEKKELFAFTSGSTGVPKRILLERKKMLASAQRTNNFFGLKKDDNACLCLPAQYIAGKMMIVRAIERNMNLYCIEPSSSPKFPQEIVIHLSAVTPMQLSRLSGLKFDSKQIKNLLIGGAKLSESKIQKLQNIACSCHETYGMTETYTHIALKKLNGNDKSNSFRALQGVSFELDSRSCLKILDKTIRNEIQTNDIVKLIDHKSFEWLGRWDNVINSGGVKIFPEKVENKMTDLFSVPFLIKAEKDEVLGEKVVLWIESEPFSDENIHGLQEKIKSRLEKYENPKEIIFLNEIPKTESGKLKRF